MMYDCNEPSAYIRCGTYFVEMILMMYLLCREFIEDNYVDLKKSNPMLPILIRECSRVSPVMFACYGE